MAADAFDLGWPLRGDHGGTTMSATTKRVLGYVALALGSYGIAIGLGGARPAAMLFVAVGVLFEGFLWMEARRSRQRRRERDQL